MIRYSGLHPVCLCLIQRTCKLEIKKSKKSTKVIQKMTQLFSSFTKLFTTTKYSRFRTKFTKYLASKKFRQVVLPISIIICTIIYIISIKLSHEKRLKAAEVSLEIQHVLGTRLTAVRLKPDQNTTRLQPTFDCEVHILSFIR